MDSARLERITRSLAFMLRHQPEKFDLEVDAFGFAPTSDVVHALNERLGEPVELEDLVEAVESGDRRRYEIEGDKIRALYGHSIPVEPGEPTKPPEKLYLGIDARDARRAEKYGLRGGRRRFLHLALTEQDAVDAGRRTAEEYTVITVRALEAWEEGVDFYDRSALFLAEEVPAEFMEFGEVQTDGTPPRPHGGGRRRGRDDDRGGRRRGGRRRDRDDDDRDRGRREERGDRDRDRGRNEERGDRDRDRGRNEERGDRDRDRGRREERGDRDRDRGRNEERGDRDRDRDRNEERGDRDRDRGRNEERGDRDRDRGRNEERGDRDRDRGRREERGDRDRDRDRSRGGDRDRGRERSRGRGGDRDRGGRGPREERPVRAREDRTERELQPARSSGDASAPAGGFGAGLFEAPAPAKPAREERRAPEPAPREERPTPPPPPSPPEPPARDDSQPGFGAGL